MSYAVAKPQASSPSGDGGPPSSATVYDFRCLFTHDLRRKQKRWQDGKLKYHSFNKKVMVYDDRGHFVGDGHWDQDGDLAPGEEFNLDRGMAIVQVDECIGEKQQDLTELLDKRAREVEKRRQIAAAKTRPTPRSSAARGAQPPAQRPHLSLSSIVQSPGRLGRAVIPTHSPFEARQQKLHHSTAPTGDSQPTVAARPPPARRRSPSPPSKNGFARSLFGATLSLSAGPDPELMAARARALRERMLSQAQPLSTPHEDDEPGAREQPVQSSPIFVQDAEETPSKPREPQPQKAQRPAPQPNARHPISSARTVMREAEEVGNRNTDHTEAEDEVVRKEKPTKKRKNDAVRANRREEPDTITKDALLDAPEAPAARLKTKAKSTDDMHLEEEEEEIPLPVPKKKKKTTEQVPRQKSRPVEEQPADIVILDEPVDEVTEAPPQRQRKEPREKPKKTKKAVEKQPTPEQPAPNPKEPRTTLRIRSRQKRGLLMMREPVPLPEPSREPSPEAEQEPEPEPEAEPEEMEVEAEVDDRIIRTPTPEPSARSRFFASLSPEEPQVVIPSSEPPAEKAASPIITEAEPPAAAEESSSDGLPPTPKRRTRKRRTYSPPPEDDEEPRSRPKRRQPAAKRTAAKADSDETANEEEPKPRQRRATKRKTYTEEAESEHYNEDDDEPAVKAPRIAKLARSGIRSREIIGYIPQGMDSLAAAPFGGGAFRLGGPPVPVVSREPSGVASPLVASPLVASPLVEKSASLPAVAEAATVDAEEESTASSPAIEDVDVMVDGVVVSPRPAVKSAASSPPPAPMAVAPLAASILPAPVVAQSPITEPVPSPIAAVTDIAETVAPKITEPASHVVEWPAPAPLSRNSSTLSTSAIAQPLLKQEPQSEPTLPLVAVPSQPNITSPLETTPKPDSPDEPAAVIPAAAPPIAEVAGEAPSSGSEANQTAKPRIANPATRGKKAARREDAAGLAPQVVVPFDPVQPVVRISTRPGAGGLVGGSRAVRLISGPASVAVAAASVAAPVPPAAAKKAVTSLAGFTAANGGTWSRHAHDLLGMGRPGRRG